MKYCSHCYLKCMYERRKMFASVYISRAKAHTDKRSAMQHIVADCKKDNIHSITLFTLFSFPVVCMSGHPFVGLDADTQGIERIPAH